MGTDKSINWSRIGRAFDFWRASGFTNIDVPWRVEREYIDATLDDPSRNRFQCREDRLCLVGSAEQSFLKLDKTSEITKGSFVTCTPCFRDDEVDDLHRREFMKIELFQTDDTSLSALHGIISDARDFFAHELNLKWFGLENDLTVSGVSTPSYTEYDILLGGVEIGSYGLRRWNGLTWIFGTGLAEPRLSIAFDMLMRNKREEKTLELNDS